MCVLPHAQGNAAAVVGQTWPRAMPPTDFSHAPPMSGAAGALGLAVLRLGAILMVEDDEGCAISVDPRWGQAMMTFLDGIDGMRKRRKGLPVPERACSFPGWGRHPR